MILMGSIFGGSSSSSKVTVSESKYTSSVGDQGYGSYTASKSATASSYPSTKNPLQKIKDDFLMDIGAKPKDADYYARLAGRNKS